MTTKQWNSLSNEYLYGRPLYPVAPLSWLAPLWSFICGVVASAAWTWTGGSLLRLLSGLLLVGPLLGIAWGASTRTKWRRKPRSDAPGNIAQEPIPALPYTLPGSASHRLVTWLCAVSAWWQRVKPRLGRPLVQLVVGSLFSLTVAAQLGWQSLALTVVGLVVAYASGFGYRRWASSPLISVSVPLFLTWLLGHSAYSPLHPASVLVAASFALTFYGRSVLNQGLKESSRGSSLLAHGLLWQVVPQAAVAASLVAVRQPIVAAVAALLGTPQLLLASLLETQPGRQRYFRAVQFQVVMSMFLTALALGHKP